jgi:ABC-type multidrug transport system ATPase subunit
MSSSTDNSTALNSEQRKRLSIGVELAAKPTNLLLLDQPLAGLDSQAALSICQLLRQIGQTGLAILCVVNQPSARLLQTFDRLLLLGEGGKQLYFGKIGPSCKTMVSYFEKNGARPCKADENPAEWTLDVTSSTENSEEAQDWSEIWSKSPECKTMKSKLVQLKKKFSATTDLVDGPDTSDAVHQSAPGFDAKALQRKSTVSATGFLSLTHDLIGAFYKYLQLENMQLPAAYPTDMSASWLTNGAAVLPPASLS